MTALLSVQNLSKRFGGLQAVADVSIEVTSGEICSVIGPNGAGQAAAVSCSTVSIWRPSRHRASQRSGSGGRFRTSRCSSTAPWSRTS
jgi:branched-chain amino acid transport system ATP-binding protein